MSVKINEIIKDFLYYKKQISISIGVIDLL